MKHTNQRGVTLVEIAIVLVIIGLLLGGILKGQELINSAKVRSIVDRQQSLKVAWFAFIDRYQGLPGDYVYAQQNIAGAGKPIVVAAQGVGFGDGVIVEGESPHAMQHMTGAGFLRCPQCTHNGHATIKPQADNSLQNQYGGIMAIFVDGPGLETKSGFTDGTYATDATSGATRQPRLMVHTGNNIPSNILAETDRKMDDGHPSLGDFRASVYKSQGLAVPLGCVDQDTTNTAQDDAPADYVTLADKAGWRYADVTPEQNCSAVVVI